MGVGSTSDVVSDFTAETIWRIPLGIHADLHLWIALQWLRYLSMSSPPVLALSQLHSKLATAAANLNSESVSETASCQLPLRFQFSDFGHCPLLCIVVLRSSIRSDFQHRWIDGASDIERIHRRHICILCACRNDFVRAVTACPAPISPASFLSLLKSSVSSTRFS